MARRPRLTWPGHGHLVRQDCVHGQPLWVDEDDVLALRRALGAMAAQHRVAIWAYALLPTALELVLCPQTSEGLGRFMQGLSRHYVPAFNRRHGRLGALWASRFRATIVEPGEWLLACVARVEQRAVRSGVPGSQDHHLGQKRDPLVIDATEFWSLGNTPFEREDAWRQRLDSEPAGELEPAMDQALRGAWPLGGHDFTVQLGARTGRPTSPRPPGRPRRRE